MSVVTQSEQHQDLVDALLADVAKYNPDPDRELLTRAFSLSEDAHAGQLRKSGADRLHNMRTLEFLGRQKQLQVAKETLEVYAPLAHRLGIHQLKWELEDLSFQTLHPRKYEEIKAMVAERRADREGHVAEAADVL